MRNHEEKVYSFIRKFIKEKRYAPVYSEIALGVNISTPHARFCVMALKQRGMVKMEHRKARTIVVCDASMYARRHR